MKTGSDWDFSTRILRGRERHPRPDYTPASTPIYASVWYYYPDPSDIDAVLGGDREGFVYGRHGNPTVSDLEVTMADLEGGAASVAFASGMAAIHAALLTSQVSAGDRIVASRDVYGATYSVLANLFPRFGIRTSFFDPTDLGSLERELNNGPVKLVMVETISNPLIKVADISTIAKMTHGVGARLIVDNTFATPYLCKPIELGADIVVHSTTKYLSGHGDSLGGVAIGDLQDGDQLRQIAKLFGGVLSPFEAWLILRGMKTLPVRLERQCANAESIAKWLDESPRVSTVNYPGLATHPQHDLATQMLGHHTFGAMISFEVADFSREDVVNFMQALKLCIPATSLGDVYTLLLHPAMSTHRTLTAEERDSFGIRDNLVRISVGLEDVRDLIDDLEQALQTSFRMAHETASAVHRTISRGS